MPEADDPAIHPAPDLPSTNSPPGDRQGWRQQPNRTLRRSRSDVPLPGVLGPDPRRVSRRPASSGRPERPLSQEQVAELEAKHLKNIRQVTYGFARAGEGYFRPDGKAIIFQAVPNLPAVDLPHAEAQRGRLPDLHGRPRPRRQAEDGQHRQGRCTCPFYHPDGKSILFASTHLNPSPTLRLRARPTSRTERYRWDSPRHGHLRGRPRRQEPRPPDRRPRLRRRGELLARRQADRLHLVPRRRRRDLHHGRRRQERRGGSPTPRATTAARSSRPTASGSSTGATARGTTCSRSTSTTPRARPSGP